MSAEKLIQEILRRVTELLENEYNAAAADKQSKKFINELEKIQAFFMKHSGRAGRV